MHLLELIEAFHICSFGSSCSEELLTKLLCHLRIVFNGRNEVELNLVKLGVI